MPIQTVLCRPVVLLLAYNACYIKVNAHGQILVDLHVIPAPLKHVHTVAEKIHTIWHPTTDCNPYGIQSEIGPGNSRTKLVLFR